MLWKIEMLTQTINVGKKERQNILLIVFIPRVERKKKMLEIIFEYTAEF